MKKNKEDEPIGAIIHIHMEVSPETPYIAVINKQKCVCGREEEVVVSV
jgi:hypothetical protein